MGNDLKTHNCGEGSYLERRSGDSSRSRWVLPTEYLDSRYHLPTNDDVFILMKTTGIRVGKTLIFKNFGAEDLGSQDES
jgi:hypothetical protein